jgi:hypothetical protein
MYCCLCKELIYLQGCRSWIDVAELDAIDCPGCWSSFLIPVTGGDGSERLVG